MKVIVGIDAQRVYEPALDLAIKCRFRGARFDLVHVMSDNNASPPGSAVSDNELKSALVLETARAAAKGLGASCEVTLLSGNPGAELIDHADRDKADLIVVQSERKGPFRSFFFGSTSRALALGATQSVLIGKAASVPAQPLRAVFATDHSAYCQNALKLFLKMHPEGIHSIHVMSAVALDDLVFRAGHLDTATVTPEIEQDVQEELETLNLKVAGKLAAAGYVTSHSAPIGFLADAISDAMEAQEADLLILGSQGHGFLERVTLGSSALHQVVSEPYSLLLLRPPQKK